MVTVYFIGGGAPQSNCNYTHLCHSYFLVFKRNPRSYMLATHTLCVAMVTKWYCIFTSISKPLLSSLPSQFTIRSGVLRFHTINQSHKNLLGSAPRLVFISVQLTAFTSSQPGQSSNSTNQLRCESILWLICDNWLWYHCENIPALFYILSLS